MADLLFDWFGSTKKSICCKFNISKSAECTQVKQEVIQTVILPLWRKWIFSDLVESILMPMRIAVSEGEWISALRCLQLYSSLSSILLVWLRQGVAKNLVQLLSKCWRRNQLALQLAAKIVFYLALLNLPISLVLDPNFIHMTEEPNGE